jgi:hypothetical protein
MCSIDSYHQHASSDRSKEHTCREVRLGEIGMVQTSGARWPGAPRWEWRFFLISCIDCLPFIEQAYAGHVSRLCGKPVLRQLLFWGFRCGPHTVHAVRCACGGSASGVNFRGVARGVSMMTWIARSACPGTRKTRWGESTRGKQWFWINRIPACAGMTLRRALLLSPIGETSIGPRTDLDVCPEIR